MLVKETARDVKILNAITAIERNQIEEVFYPFRPHRYHLTTRFGLSRHAPSRTPLSRQDGPIIRSIPVARPVSENKKRPKTARAAERQVRN